MTNNTGANTSSVDKINSMRQFMSEFSAIVQGDSSDRSHGITKFLSEFREATQSSTSTLKMNVLDLTRVGNDEVTHSSILAWLLDPRSHHACGTLFLRSFLKVADIEIDEEQLQKVYVRKEVQGSESIIDLFIYNPRHFLIYIENKTLSPEGDDQINREFRDLHRFGSTLRIPVEKLYPIFLTPSGCQPTSGDPDPWYTISYPALAQEFEGILPDVNDQKLVFFIEDIIEKYRCWR